MFGDLCIRKTISKAVRLENQHKGPKHTAMPRSSRAAWPWRPGHRRQMVIADVPCRPDIIFLPRLVQACPKTFGTVSEAGAQVNEFESH